MSVSNLSVILIEDTTIVLKWAYFGQDEYRINIATVEIQIHGSNEQKSVLTLNSTETSAMFGSLQPLTNYFFSIYIAIGAKRSPPSNISAATLSSSMFNHICCFVELAAFLCRIATALH